MFFCLRELVRFFLYWSHHETKKKNGQVLNKAPFCKSRQIYIYILLDGLVGSSVGFFFGGGGGVRARRASQNKKDKIKYPTIVLAKPSNRRFIIQLQGYIITSVNVDCSFNDNEWEIGLSRFCPEKAKKLLRNMPKSCSKVAQNWKKLLKNFEKLLEYF